MNNKPFWVCTNDHSNQGHHMYCEKCGERQAYPTCKNGHRVEWAGQMCDTCIREAEMSDKMWEVGKKYYLNDDREVKVVDIDKKYGAASILVRCIIAGGPVLFFNMNGENHVYSVTLTTREVKEPNFVWVNTYDDKKTTITYHVSSKEAQEYGEDLEARLALKYLGRKRIDLNEIEGVWDD